MKAETVIADVVFVAREEGGRDQPPQSLASRMYRPHLYPETLQEGTWEPQEVTSDSSLFGVQFIDGPEVVEEAECYRVILRLMYDIDYTPLLEKRTFTIREGTRAVGFGIILPEEKGAVE